MQDLSKPFYTHIDDCCTFVGGYINKNQEREDLYICADRNNVIKTVSHRFGNDDWEYGSGLVHAAHSPIHREALDRGLALGFKLDKRHSYLLKRDIKAEDPVAIWIIGNYGLKQVHAIMEWSDDEIRQHCGFEEIQQAYDKLRRIYVEYKIKEKDFPEGFQDLYNRIEKMRVELSDEDLSSVEEYEL